MAEIDKNILDILNKKQDALEVATEISKDNDNPVASSAVAKMFDKYSDGQWNVSIEVDNELDASSERPVSNKTLVAEFEKKQDKIEIDKELSTTSGNPVQNKVISAKIASIDSDFEKITRKTEDIKKELDCKQDNIEIETTIDKDSDLPVSSSAVAKVLEQYTDGKWQVEIPVDDKIDALSENPVQNKVIASALSRKQDKIDIDTELSPISTNPVENKAIYQAIEDCKESAKTINSQEYIRLLNTKQDALEVVASVEADNDYPVASSAVHKALNKQKQELEDYIKVEGGKIDSISVNGEKLDIIDKNVDISVPTSTSQITNDSDFITHEDIVNKADKSEIPTKVTDLSDAGNYALISEVEAEAELREAADNDLQSQIDAITASSDVKDIVSTKADLDNYNKSKLGDNDIIKVLSDESQENATTYYRFHKNSGIFELLGATGPYYTKNETDAKFVDNTDSRLTDARTPLAHRHDIVDIDNFPTDIAKDTDLEALRTELRAKDTEIEEILETKANASDLGNYATKTELETEKNNLLDYATSQHTAILGKLESDYTETKDLAPVALSGEYSDLENAPTKVSEFENDENFVKREEADATYGTIKKISINDEELPNVEGVVNIEGQAPVYHEIDEEPVKNSKNLITSGAVFEAIAGTPGEIDAVKDLVAANSLRINSVETNLNTKADKGTTLAAYGITDAKIEDKTITLGDKSISVETELPVEDVQVDGQSIVEDKIAKIKTKTPTKISGKPVGKLGIDETPTQDSNNLVRSGGVKNALDSKVDKTSAVVDNTMDIKSTNDTPMPILYLRDKNNAVLGQVEAYNGQVGIGPSWEAGLRIGNSLPRPLYQGVEVALMEDLEDIGGASSWNDLSDKPTTISGFGITDAYTKAEINDTLDGLSNVAKSGSYNDLDDKPSIPPEVTETTVANWGFSKTTGTYSKPTNGIPKTDLATAVQTSLGKADSAVQPSDISDMETKANAAATYQPKGNYQPAGNYQIAGDYATNSALQAVDNKISTFLGTDSETLSGLKTLIAQAEESGEIAALESAIGGKQDKITESNKLDYSLLSGTPTIPTVNYPVTSVNSKTGAVVLSAADVGALPDTLEVVKSVNGSTPDEDGNVFVDIPTQITESNVASWGFTKNTGTYSKPNDGIPKTDLSQDVQNKLDNALTEEQYQGTVKSVNGNTPDSNGNVQITLPDTTTVTVEGSAVNSINFSFTNGVLIITTT